MKVLLINGSPHAHGCTIGSGSQSVDVTASNGVSGSMGGGMGGGMSGRPGGRW